uniref:Uncharacterized protein n=1 Tax=Kalanchoe fedtschenkoi TaxID=63787 RepID=A0A7N0ZWA6_KALFE
MNQDAGINEGSCKLSSKPGRKSCHTKVTTGLITNKQSCLEESNLKIQAKK